MVNKFFEGLQDRVAAAAETAPTTEQALGDLLSERERIAAQMLDLAANGSFGEEIIGFDDYGQAIMGQSGDSKQLGALADTFDILGDLAKTGSGTGGLSGEAANVLSANTAAQIAQQDRQLAESMRQFDVSEARQGREFSESLAFNREELATTEAGAMSRLQTSIASEEKRAAAALQEEQRRNNLSSTLDLLTNQIRTGELGVAEASNRISAATNAAQIQRDILADHAGKALPAGTSTFPNLGANGPIAAMAKSLGQPFVPFETMGTFAIDPSAIAAPISSAPGNSMMPGVNDAVAAAARALAGMGVPQMADGGLVDGPYISGEQGPEINFPMGGGRTFVMNRDMMGGGDDLQQRFPGAASMMDIMRNGYRNPDAPTGLVMGGNNEGGDWPRPGMPMGAPMSTPLTQPMPAMRPEMWEQLQRYFQGFGVVPPTRMGSGMRPPQMGLQNIIQALAGG